MASMSEFEQLKEEIALQQMTKHQNVVEIIAAFAHNAKLSIVLELMDVGSLTDVVTKHIVMPEPMIAYVVKQCFMVCTRLPCFFIHTLNRIL